MSNVLKNSGKLVLALAVVFALSFASSARAADAKGKVEGKVVDKDGKGVAGVKVRLMTATDQKGHKKGDAPGGAGAGSAADKEKVKPVAEGTSESDGKYTLSDVPPGDYIANARSKGVGMAKSKVTVKAGETASLELKLGEAKGGGKKKDKGAN